jgi:hypothetical protein
MKEKRIRFHGREGTVIKEGEFLYVVRTDDNPNGSSRIDKRYCEVIENIVDSHDAIVCSCKGVNAEDCSC